MELIADIVKYSGESINVYVNTYLFLLACIYVCLVTQSCLTLCYVSMDYSPPGYSVNADSPGKNTGAGCHALLQGIFPTQELNPGYPDCKWILSHQGSPTSIYMASLFIYYLFPGKNIGWRGAGRKGNYLTWLCYLVVFSNRTLLLHYLPRCGLISKNSFPGRQKFIRNLHQKLMSMTIELFSSFFPPIF